jgi:hypothetical protein
MDRLGDSLGWLYLKILSLLAKAIDTSKTNVNRNCLDLSLLRKVVTPTQAGAGVQKALLKYLDSLRGQVYPREGRGGNDIAIICFWCFIISLGICDIYAGINKLKPAPRTRGDKNKLKG